MPDTTLRLLFRHEGGDIRLEALMEVAVRAPATHERDRRPGAVPFYYELQDEGGRVLYRRIRSHPAPVLHEVPTDDSDGRFAYREGDRRASGAFSILVPALPAGRFVELFGSPGGVPGEDWTSLGRFELDAAPRAWGPPEVGS